MKKILTIFIAAILFLVAPVGIFSNVPEVLAQSPSASPSISQSLLQKLTNEIASKTAQLNLVEKRGVIGTVTDSSDTQLTLTDVDGNATFIDVDELTKFSNPNTVSGTFGISDITKGMTVGVLGLYNKQSQRILARDIDVVNIPNVLTGAVSSIDNKNYNFYIVDDSNKQTFIDVEVVTKTYSYSASGSLINSGFSKITENETVIVTGFPDKQNPSHIIATRVILFPDVPKNPKINIAPALNPNASIVPSTGSGRKLVPIVK